MAKAVGTGVTGGAPFVRPRYLTEGQDDPLPLQDHFEESFLAADAPRTQLAIVGPRGSGLTTTIRWLHQLIAAHPSERVPLDAADLLEAPGPGLERLAAGSGILLIDTSVTPIDLPRWLVLERLFKQGVPGEPGSLDVLREARLVVACPEAAFRGAVPHREANTWTGWLARPRRIALAPWCSDDLLELLGSSPELRPARARVFAALRAASGLESILGVPRCARLLVEAALDLGPREPATWGRLYANVLDRLSPQLIELLLEMREDWLAPETIERLLLEPPADPHELAAFFELPRILAGALSDPHEYMLRLALKRGMLSAERLELLKRLDAGLPGDAVARLGLFSRREYRRLRGATPLPHLKVELALPGLQDFVQAGRCLQGVARGEVPARVERRWFPFLDELKTPAVLAELRDWLTRGADPHAGKGDAAAATILHACGEGLPLATHGDRAFCLDGAWLGGACLDGAALGGASLAGTRLEGASLIGAQLQGSSLRQTLAREASFALAHLHDAKLVEADLSGACLCEVVAHDADLVRVRLNGADLRQAELTRAIVSACELREACLRDATLDYARLVSCDLARVDLRGAQLRRAELRELDLRQAYLDGACLDEATLNRCQLADLNLDGLAARGLRLDGCDLSETRLAGAELRGADLRHCRAHGAVFDGADLRGVRFQKVDFQAGSARCGLLLDKPALEGSRTGFYAEGTTEDAWASPESIRQGSFRGADLRGATFHHTDLFRVDLRGARLDPKLREQALRAGAILER